MGKQELWESGSAYLLVLVNREQGLLSLTQSSSTRPFNTDFFLLPLEGNAVLWEVVLNSTVAAPALSNAALSDEGQTWPLLEKDNWG